jgi:hypothetical protein
MQASLASVFALEVDPREAALRETEQAIGLVLKQQEPVELAPQNAYIRRLQHQMAERANLVSRSRGREPYRRVRLYPDAAKSGLDHGEFELQYQPIFDVHLDIILRTQQVESATLCLDGCDLPPFLSIRFRYKSNRGLFNLPILLGVTKTSAKGRLLPRQHLLGNQSWFLRPDKHPYVTKSRK